MVLIALLDLPLALPPDSPAWTESGDTFRKGLPEYLARCEWSECHRRSSETNVHEAKRSREASLAHREMRRMEHMPFAPWPVYVSWAPLARC